MIAETSNDDNLAQEADLVHGAKQRDPDAWSALYDRFYPTIFQYAFACLGSRQEAEDLAAQVFLEALKNIDHLAYRGRPIRSWFHGIAHNLIAQRTRRNLREKHASASGGLDESRQELSETIIQRVDLSDALKRLTADQRDVIILRFFLSMSIRETAEALGKTENATSVLQVRAIGALRRQLSETKLTHLLGHDGVSA